MTIPYGDPPIMFTRYALLVLPSLTLRASSTYLVLNNRIVGAIVAVLMLTYCEYMYPRLSVVGGVASLCGRLPLCIHTQLSR
jgi:hypothetical protein